MFRGRRSRTIGAAIESLTWVAVRTAWTPIAAAPLSARWQIPRSPVGLFRRFPQLATREVAQRHVLIGPPKLGQRRQQLFTLARAERGRLAIDQNGPVDVA